MFKNRRTGCFSYAIPCTAIVCTFWIYFASTYQGQRYARHRSRVLHEVDAADSAVVDCIPSGMESFPPDFLTQEQRLSGGVVIHCFILFYACVMTAIVCDVYFVPALEAISDRLQLSPDVAGATFMAMGASAPELFSSIAGAFITEGDIGLGTILGSAVFNILGISGIVGLVLWNRALPIRWYPVIRDCIVYGITVSVLTFIISDNIVKWWEALTLLTLFATYIVIMHFNPVIENATKKAAKKLHITSCHRRNLDPEKGPLLDGKQTKITSPHLAESRCSSVEKRDEVEGQAKDDENGADECCCSFAWSIFTWVPSLLFRLTIPPVRFYPATFAMSIIWMGALSYVAVWMVTIIGFTLSIPDAVSGLTLLAAGSSVPDLVATVLIARSGQGNMAISNLLGSNTFDLAFCLGAPWFFKALISGKGQLLIYSSAMVYTTITLLVTLLILLGTFQLTRWRLNKTTGFVFFSLYVVCITLACLYELNVFGPINKPTCF